MKKSLYFEKIPYKNCPEVSCFMRCHNVHSYNISGKEAQNWRKKCYVMCVLLENLLNGFMKGQILW